MESINMMGCSIRVCTCYCPASVSPWSMVGLHVCVFVVVSMRTLSSSSACAGEGCWECLVCTAVAGPGVAQAASSARTSPMLDLWWLLSSRTLGKKRYMFAACFPRNVVKYAAHTPNMVRENHLPQMALLYAHQVLFLHRIGRRNGSKRCG